MKCFQTHDFIFYKHITQLKNVAWIFSQYLSGTKDITKLSIIILFLIWEKVHILWTKHKALTIYFSAP